MAQAINSGGADRARYNAQQAGRELGERMDNTKLGKAVNKAGVEVGKSFMDYGKAISKAAQETFYGNIKKTIMI